MKILLLFIICILGTSCISAQKNEDHNLNFESQQNNSPEGWKTFGNGDYKTSLDSIVFHTGKFSGKIENLANENGFGAWAYEIPATYGGKKIKLAGYVKTENVTGGAGLWMRIDPEVDFDNMQSRAIKGTTDWTKYEITLDLKPEQATQIVVGGLIVGNGTIWVDNLLLTIDGKSLAFAPEKTLTKAQRDTTFNNGSKINFTNLSNLQIENLTILGKVWGFLKYHHPIISKGEYNWDYELFRIMDKIANAPNQLERDENILNWINSYGTIKSETKPKKINEDAIIKPDLRWIASEIKSKQLQDKLREIDAVNLRGKQYYVGTFPNVGNPDFKNENPYVEMTYPDAGFRLLSLYRYWNMIQYFSPNREITDKDWNAILKEYIPLFVNTNNELDYEIAALKLIGEVHDTHSNLWGGGDKYRATLGNKYPPFKVNFVEEKLVVTDYYNPEMKGKIGLEIGDIITKINNVPISNLVEEKLPNYPASNLAAKLRDLSENILRSDADSIVITFQRNSEEKDTTIPLFKIKDINHYHWYRVNKDEKSYKMLADNIGYISLANIKNEDLKSIKEELKDTRGLIIDIRNYPSEFMVFNLGGWLSPKGTPFVKFTNANLNNPGEFNYTKPETVGRGSLENSYKGKVVILVNELSQSQAEYTAMAFRASPNATVVGSTTAGADGNVSTILLPGGLRTMISGIGIFYPNGEPTQRIGIVPDVEVKPTITGIREGRDELMEAAMKIINE